MNQQLERRLRKLEETCAATFNESRDIRIVWATASRVGGLQPRADPEVALDLMEGGDSPAVDAEKINDDS